MKFYTFFICCLLFGSLLFSCTKKENDQTPVQTSNKTSGNAGYLRFYNCAVGAATPGYRQFTCDIVNIMKTKAMLFASFSDYGEYISVTFHLNSGAIASTEIKYSVGLNHNYRYIVTNNGSSKVVIDRFNSNTVEAHFELLENQESQKCFMLYGTIKLTYRIW